MSLSTAWQLSSDSHFAVPLTMYSLFLAMAHVEKMCLRPRVLSRSYSTCRVSCRGGAGDDKDCRGRQLRGSGLVCE